MGHGNSELEEGIGVGGRKFLTVIPRGTWKASAEEGIWHENEISLVLWVNARVLATADVEGELRVWDYRARKLLYKYKNDEAIMSLKYS